MIRRVLRGWSAAADPRPNRPDVDVLRMVQHLEMRTRGFVESLFTGEHLSVFLGRGMEFSHVRGYQIGDDVRAIDWKVTARKGTPYVRQFVEERDMLVVLVVDVSASGRQGPGDRSPFDVATEIAAALTFAATRNNDRVGLLLVSDRVEHHVQPGSGRKHAVGLLADLVADRAQRRETDLTPALDRIARSRHGRGTVFLISDFIQDRPGPAFRSALSRAARVHDLVAVRLASPGTDQLPNVGWVEMTDPESGRRVALDSGSRRVRTRFEHGVRRARSETTALLAEVGAELIDVNTTTDPLATVTEFLRRRRRVHR